MTKQCNRCEGLMNYRQGISKSGKPYAGYFCDNCENKEWLNPPKTQFIKQKEQIKIKEEPDWDAIRAEKESGMNWLNAKNNATQIVMALINQGTIKDHESTKVMLSDLIKYFYDQKEPE